MSDGSASTGAQNRDLLTRTDSVIQVLSDDYTGKQVALDFVHKNPFVTDSEGKTVIQAPVSTGNPDHRKAQRQTALELAGNRFKLKSVIMGATPMAIVDGRILRVGDSIDVKDLKISYRVTEIATDSVTLVAEDPEFELKVTSVVQLSRDR